MADYSGDETDGLNETLCPCDFKHVSSDLMSRLLASMLHLHAPILDGPHHYHCHRVRAHNGQHRAPEHPPWIAV